MTRGQPNEPYVADLIRRRSGLELRKLPENGRKTPDFTLVDPGNPGVTGVCEMKTLEHVVPGSLGQLISRPGFSSRIHSKICQSWKQLEGRDGPKAFLLVNESPFAGIGDLEKALQSASRPAGGLSARAGKVLAELDLVLWVDLVRDGEIRIVRGPFGKRESKDRGAEARE